MDPFIWPSKSRVTSSNSSSVRIRDVALRNGRKRWTIGRGGERGLGISVLMARQDDDDYYSSWKFFTLGLTGVGFFFTEVLVTAGLDDFDFSFISSSPTFFFTGIHRTVSKAPTTISITIAFIFHCLFSFLAIFKYLSHRLFLLSLCYWFEWQNPQDKFFSFC